MFTRLHRIDRVRDRVLGLARYGKVSAHLRGHHGTVSIVARVVVASARLARGLVGREGNAVGGGKCVARCCESWRTVLIDNKAFHGRQGLCTSFYPTYVIDAGLREVSVFTHRVWCWREIAGICHMTEC